MIRASAGGKYGLRAVLDLALHYGQGCVQNADIAARQNIPESYLVQLLNLLRRGGVLLSIRGPNGGHTLSRHPDRVTAGEVLGILEGPVDLLGEQEGQREGNAEQDVLRKVWKEVEVAIDGVLSSITFGDLCRSHRAERESIVYRI